MTRYDSLIKKFKKFDVVITTFGDFANFWRKNGVNLENQCHEDVRLSEKVPL
jgi:hypothetical protein